MPMARYSADLHVHTIYSDGSFTPRELVKRARALKLNAVAVTDHDDIDGVHPARVAGEKLGVRVIPGVELSAHHDGIEVHIIGLFVDVLDARFLELLQRLQRLRLERIRLIAECLGALGVELAADDVLAVAGRGAPSRAHAARALVKKGLATDIREAFRRYLGDYAPCNVPKNFLSMAEAIDAVRRCGGVAVFAHPGLTRHDELLPIFARLGGQAIEVYYPSYSRQQTRQYLAIARQLELLPSGGSDCHGLNRPELRLGKMRLPERIVTELERLARFGMPSV